MTPQFETKDIMTNCISKENQNMVIFHVKDPTLLFKKINANFDLNI